MPVCAQLTKHSAGLQVLLLTFRASLEGLALFGVALAVCILIFSSLVYYMELSEPESTIHSIPDAFWYSIMYAPQPPFLIDRSLLTR